MKVINKYLNRLIPIADELITAEVDLYTSPVSAGFPSEAYNYIEKGIDFKKLLIKGKESTFCLYAGGNSLRGDGIFIGALKLAALGDGKQWKINRNTFHLAIQQE